MSEHDLFKSAFKSHQQYLKELDNSYLDGIGKRATSVTVGIKLKDKPKEGLKDNE